MPAHDPDEALVPIFKHRAKPNAAKTAIEGRPIFDDEEVVEIRRPGSKDYSVHPVTEVCGWSNDPETGFQSKITYAERFSKQYQQFKAHSQQTKSGTPLADVPFLSEGKRAELRAQNVYTVEALATIDGQELKNLGHGGRELKNAAMEFVEDSRKGAPNKQMQTELEALKARNAMLEQDVETLKNSRIDPEFQDMTAEQLRDYVTAQTGHAPHGTANRKTLLQMAMTCRPDKVA